MADRSARLETMREMFVGAYRLYSWEFSSDGRLVYSNCPVWQIFGVTYSRGFSSRAISGHFEGSALPCVANEGMGLAWVAATENMQDGSNLHLLGPILTKSASEIIARQDFSRLVVPESVTHTFVKNLELISTISLNAAVSFAVMLNYCVNGVNIDAGDVVFLSEPAKEDTGTGWASINWHGTWEMEQEMLKKLETGQDFSMADIASNLGGGRVGNFCPGDALRQSKDEVIIFAVLGSRAIIRGGVSPEGGYNLADNFIQRVETSKNIGEVYALAQSMLDAMKERVQRVKEYKKYSPPVSESMEYIELNILNRISLNDVAAELGYSTYYISRRFKEETGVGMNSYIRKRKVERSKEYMENSELSLSEISERLSFSSQSYFSSVFRQETGMSPSEYMHGSRR